VLVDDLAEAGEELGEAIGWDDVVAAGKGHLLEPDIADDGLLPEEPGLDRCGESVRCRDALAGRGEEAIDAVGCTGGPRDGCQPGVDGSLDVGERGGQVGVRVAEVPKKCQPATGAKDAGSRRSRGIAGSSPWWWCSRLSFGGWD